MGRGETDTGFWWRNLRERDHLGDPEVNTLTAPGTACIYSGVGVR